MKRLSTLFVSFTLSMAAFATNYPGNGKTGFGGPVGPGSLDVTYSAPNLTFTLNRGTGAMNDVLVIYIDAGAGGFTSTSFFNDYSTPLMAAISGYDGQPGHRAVYNFSSGFAPDIALAMFPNNSNGAVAVALSPTTHTTLMTPPLTNNGNANASSYSVTLDVSALFPGGTVMFSFIGTLISGTAYRSEEAIGDSMTGFSQGWNPYTQTTPPLVFNSAMPVTLSSFTGALKDGNAKLNWTTKAESNANRFEIERSAGGNEWSTLGSVRATNASSGAQYTYTDTRRITGSAYYRLKMVDNYGRYKTSSVIKVTAGAVSDIKIMGSPSYGRIVLNISNPSAAKYNIELFATDGRKITSLAYNHSGGVSSVEVPAKDVQTGLYMLKASTQNEHQTFHVLMH